MVRLLTTEQGVHAVYISLETVCLVTVCNKPGYDLVRSNSITTIIRRKQSQRLVFPPLLKVSYGTCCSLRSWTGQTVISLELVLTWDGCDINIVYMTMQYCEPRFWGRWIDWDWLTDRLVWWMQWKTRVQRSKEVRYAQRQQFVMVRSPVCYVYQHTCCDVSNSQSPYVQ